LSKRILLITHFFPPGHVGGTEVLSFSLAQELASRGHHVQVICAEDWDSAPGHTIKVTDEQLAGIAVRRLHFNWTKAPDVFRSLYANAEVKRYLSQYLIHDRPDLVHITSCYSLSASVIEAISEAGIPCILTATDFWFLCARNTLLENNATLCSGPELPWKCARCHVADAKIYRWSRSILPESMVAKLLLHAGKYPLLNRQPGLRGMVGDWEDRQRYLMSMLKRVDCIVTASHFLRNLFVRYGVADESISIAPYGINTGWATGFTTKSPSPELRIGFIGQILPAKGPDLLLRAIRSLEPELPIHAIIYGDLNKSPAFGQHLRELAGADPRISFAGTFENSQMGQVLADIDLLAVPSLWYDFPLVIPSALATRTPVLATDLPGMNEAIVNGVNGLLFVRGDWQGLAAHLHRCIAEPELLSTLRDGITPVKSVAQMTTEYLELYQRVCAGAPSQKLSYATSA
jgi:glycosyltransferase involved in cell wall biosynthesis